jgi:uncharacterized phage protein gp47/JayE
VAFTRPTLAQLVDRIQQDFVSRLELSAPLLRRSMVYVLSRVMAGAAHMLHGHLDWASVQVLPDQAEEAGLLRWTRLFGMSKTPATFATGSLTITGTNGSIIPATTVYLRSDGAEYTVDADVTISGGTATAALTASVAGAAGSCDAGASLALESPIAGVDSTAVVAVGGLTGSDEESTEALRTRFLEHLRTPPQGGSEADYIAWAKEVPGVTRVFVAPLEDGPGTVKVRFVRDDDSGSIFPSSPEVTAVQDHIDSVRPVTAIVTVEAPTAVTRNYTIGISPDTAETRAAVEAELIDMLRRDATPGMTLRLSRIQVAVGTSDGVDDYTVTVPHTDTVYAADEMPSHGTITWV